MANKKILEFQVEFLRRLEKHFPPPQYNVPLILQKILECDESTLEFLGKIGPKLRLFAQTVDFTHPEIISVFDGILADGQDFSQECLELLSRSDKKQGPYFSNNIIKKIDAPYNNKLNVRLLRDAKDREEIRLTKRMQRIAIQVFLKKGVDAWQAQPDNFSRFMRFDVAYQDDLQKAEKKASRYEELGCLALANEVRKSIDLFRQNIEQAYYGFNRISLTTVAVILAKSLGFSFIEAQDVPIKNFRTDAKVGVDRNFFKKYNFDPNQVFEIATGDLTASNIFVQRQENYIYEPRVYPFYEFADIASVDIQKTIAVIEEFPDAGNKPIFDHFGLVVPGVAFPKAISDEFVFLDEQGMAQAHATLDSAVKALDKILIKSEYICPIVVGEKDAKCYFISYFV